MNRILVTVSLALLFFALECWIPIGDARLIYNATDSAPRGWYWIQPENDYSVGDEVLIDLPESVAHLAAERRYLPAGVPLLKRVGARGGQQICLRDRVVRIEGMPLAIALSRDTAGRPLQAWAQCRLLLAGELFLLNPAKAASFDSRYFGPVPMARARGRAIPLWTWDTP